MLTVAVFAITRRVNLTSDSFVLEFNIPPSSTGGSIELRNVSLTDLLETSIFAIPFAASNITRAVWPIALTLETWLQPLLSSNAVRTGLLVSMVRTSSFARPLSHLVDRVMGSGGEQPIKKSKLMNFYGSFSLETVSVL